MMEPKDKARIRKAAAEAFIRLQHNQDFKAYQEYLALFQTETREKGDILISPHKEWNQGWCQCLTYVLDLPTSINS